MPLLHKPQQLLAMLTALFVAAVLFAPGIHAANGTARPTDQQVRQAIKKLQADPNLAVEKKINTLHWITDNKKPEDAKIPGWLRWIRSLFVWLAQTSRVLLWTVLTILAALIVIFLLRVLRNHQRTQRLPLHAPPAFVGDLDIRPESMPEDIGAAVWQLWQQNEHRNALSLLYRGLLSRLAHQFLVPIQDSSTEAQCLELARAQLQTSQTEYVSRALKIWQFAVYGAQLPNDQEVHALCEQFSAALDAAPRPGTEHAA